MINIFDTAWRFIVRLLFLRRSVSPLLPWRLDKLFASLHVVPMRSTHCHRVQLSISKSSNWAPCWIFLLNTRLSWFLLFWNILWVDEPRKQTFEKFPNATCIFTDHFDFIEYWKVYRVFFFCPLLNVRNGLGKIIKQ